MKLRKTHWIGIAVFIVILIVDIVFFIGEDLFMFLFGIGLMIMILPFLIGLVSEGKAEREKSEEFLDFTRSLAESVKTGTPVGKSIVNIANKDFGVLTPHIRKLANQISLGIPTSRALETFSLDVDNVVVKRAVSLIREAENAGGNIDSILDSTAESIYEIEKLRRERKAAISNLVVQGYIIFLIFLVIMLIMQFKILPLTAGASGLGNLEALESGATGGGFSPKDLTRPLLYLLLVQGFFAGLTIGKISEGSLRSGVKHSIILVLLALLITSGANVFLTPTT
jgi:archaeal flagellar protein FlaJ